MRSRVRQKNLGASFWEGWGWESPGTEVGGKSRLAGKDLAMVGMVVSAAQEDTALLL